MINKMMNNTTEEVMLQVALEEVKVDNIQDMVFTSFDGFQTVSILVEDQAGNRVDYLMRATKSFEIHGINQLLKSLDLGITIEFVTFAQYELMIDYCMHLVNAKRKATA